MVKIGNKQYRMPISWSDLSLLDAERIDAITMPEVMKQRYEIILNSKDLETELFKWSEEVQFEDIMPYIKKVVESLLWVDSVTLERTNTTDLMNIYFTHLEQFVIGIYDLGCNFVPNDITDFELEKVTYKLPKEKIIFGQSVPLESMLMAQYCECADMINLMEQEGGLRFLSYAIACLALPDGVKYSEDLVLDNGEKFKELDMQTALDVFFCLIDSVSIFEVAILSYSAKAPLRKSTPKRVAEWKSTDGQVISSTWQKALCRLPLSLN